MRDLALYYPYGEAGDSIKVIVIDVKGTEAFIRPTDEGQQDADFMGYIFDPDGETVDVGALVFMDKIKRIARELDKKAYDPEGIDMFVAGILEYLGEDNVQNILYDNTQVEIDFYDKEFFIGSDDIVWLENYTGRKLDAISTYGTSGIALIFV